MGKIKNIDLIEEISLDIYNIAKVNSKSHKEKINPLTVIAIAQIVLELIKFMLEFYNDKIDICIESIGKLNFIKKFVLWRFICSKVESKRDCKYIYSAFLDVILNLSEDDKNKLFDIK